MGYLTDFLLAVLSEWVALMGGLASVIVAIWLHIRNKSAINSAVFWIIGGICLFIAFFSAWKKEHIALQDERGKNAPTLYGEIFQINTHPLKSVGGNGVGVLLVVQIRNLGADSISQDYEISSIIGNVLTYGELHVVPHTLTLTSDNGVVNVFYGKDALYEKTYLQPIRKGGAVTGVLWAWFNGIERGVFDDKTLKLTFSDVTGRTYTVVRPATKDHSPKHFPGLSDSP